MKKQKIKRRTKWIFPLFQDKTNLITESVPSYCRGTKYWLCTTSVPHITICPEAEFGWVKPPNTLLSEKWKKNWISKQRSSARYGWTKASSLRMLISWITTRSASTFWWMFQKQDCWKKVADSRFTRVSIRMTLNGWSLSVCRRNTFIRSL